MGIRVADVRRLGLVAIAALLFLSKVEALNTRPKAPHLVYRVSPGGQVEVEIRGYDVDGHKLTPVITGLPEMGQVYDLSQIYAVHGQLPKAQQNAVTSAGHTVPSVSKHRIIYQAPSHFTTGTYATLRYTVSDGQATSAEGLVRIVHGDESSLPVLVSSEFSDDSEGWRILNNGASLDVTHERSSVSSGGARLNQFIYAEDARVNIDQSTGGDKVAWYFSAPSKFLGNQVHSYGGSLSFVLGAFSGDFSESRRNADLDFVILECRTCNMGKGMRFAKRMSEISFDGSPKNFQLRLSENNWLKDPKNTLHQWTTPSQCEFVEMLSSLSAIKVLGDFTNFYESVGIDSVQIVAASAGNRSPVPLVCLCSNPGTQCS